MQNSIPVSPQARPLRLLRDEDAPTYDPEPDTARARERFSMIPHAVYDTLSGDGYALAVYGVLVKHAGREGTCWPSVATICAAVGWSRKIVEPAIKRLIDAGLVTKERRQLNGMDQSSAYRITAYERVVPTELAVVPTAPMGSSQGTIGTFPQNDELEPIELDNVKTPIVPKKPLPANGAAQQIVKAFCEAAGLEQPANYRKAVGQAAQIAKAGVTPEQIPDLYAFVVGWAGGADLGTLLNQIDRWRSSKKPSANGAMPPEIKRLPWDNAKRRMWEQEHRP